MHWNGLVLDRNERLAIGDKEDGQDDNEQREAAVRIISNRGQNRRRSPGRTGEPGEGYSWDEVSIGTQMLSAIRQVADTLVAKRLQRIDRAGLSGYDTWLESRITSMHERTTCARVLAVFQLHATPVLWSVHKKWLRWLFGEFVAFWCCESNTLLLSNADSLDELLIKP